MSNELSGPLTKTEQRSLATAERTIQQGYKAYCETGEALALIRDQRLYRASFTSWDAYCRQRWGFTAAHANNYIASARAAIEGRQLGLVFDNEYQAREFSKVPTERRETVARNVLDRAPRREGGDLRITASLIRDVANDVSSADTSAESGRGGGQEDRGEGRPASCRRKRRTATPEPVDTSQAVEATDAPAEFSAPSTSAIPDGAIICPYCDGVGHVYVSTDMPTSLADSPEFLEAWAEWIVYQKERRRGAKLPASTMRSQWRTLERMGVEDACDSIRQSIHSGWQGLFAVKRGNARSSSNGSKVNAGLVYQGSH
jgi:hypothetical protein